MRRAVLVLLCSGMLLAGVAIGRASDQDEATVTVQVRSADHEMQEGYFSLGETATVLVQPGSDLYRFLCRQRGRTVKLTLTEDAGRTLSRLDRGGQRR